MLLGNISFCFYLVHQLVLRVFTAEVGHDWLAVSTGVRSLKVLALVLGVSLVAAWLLHTLVEKPMEKLLRGRAPRSARPATPPEEPDEHVPDARTGGFRAAEPPMSDLAVSDSVRRGPAPGRHRGLEVSAPRQRSR